jgi:hypothetical protein
LSHPKRNTDYIIQRETFDKTYPDPNSNYNLEESNTSILVLSIWQYVA